MCGWLHVWSSEDNLWEPILLLVGNLWGLTPHFIFLTNYIFGLGHQYIILRNGHHLTCHTPFRCWIIAQAEDSLYFPTAKSNSQQSKTGSSVQREHTAQLYNRRPASVRWQSVWRGLCTEIPRWDPGMDENGPDKVCWSCWSHISASWISGLPMCLTTASLAPKASVPLTHLCMTSQRKTSFWLLVGYFLWHYRSMRK